MILTFHSAVLGLKATEGFSEGLGGGIWKEFVQRPKSVEVTQLSGREELAVLAQR